ncbi:TPA: Rrf2 family transcriptional regulator [Citrobacter freundii]|nr:Rrf2 family transcriptional regulator [Citrobacter freundii]HAT3963899.1 Rrf2 family transcriptional regulator [Citrobacter freundii]
MKKIRTAFSPFNPRAAHMIDALKFLHEKKVTRPDGFVTSRAVAEGIGLSGPAFEPLAKLMISNRWVKSQKGPGGGYIMNVDIEKLTVFDVISVTNNTPIKDNAFVRFSKDISVSQF